MDREATGDIAHDLNNLVAIVTMGCDLLLRRLAEGDPARPVVEDIAGAAVRAAELTRRLLAMSLGDSVGDAEPETPGDP
jgi:signal transduction histidine kinase